MSLILEECPNGGVSIGFYGIKVAETDGSPSLDGIIKLNFESGDFAVSLTAGETDEATIEFTGTAGDGGGGFYGINVGQVNFPAFHGINTVKFNTDDFYVDQNFPNTDEVVVSSRNNNRFSRIFLGNGSLGEPSLSFTTDTDTGMFLSSPGSLRFTSNGVAIMTITESDAVIFPNLSVSGNIIMGGGDFITMGVGTRLLAGASGTPAAPPVSFTDASTSGVLWDTDNDGVAVSVRSATELLVKRDVVEVKGGFYTGFGEPIYDLVAGSGITLTELDNPHAFQIDAVATPDPGFYGIIIEESDGSNTLRDDTIRFAAADFDISEVNSKPQVDISTNIARISDIGPGFYGINVGQTPGVMFKGINTLKFDSDHFYVNANPGSDETDIHLRNVILRNGTVGMTGQLTFLTNNLGVRAPTTTALAPFPGGSMSNPAYTFVQDATTGFGMPSLTAGQVAGRRIFLIGMGGKSRFALTTDKLVVNAGFYSSVHGEPAYRRVVNVASPASEWEIAHNIGSPNINYNLWSSNGKELIPENAFSNDPNTAFFYFLTPQIGRAVISGGR